MLQLAATFKNLPACDSCGKSLFQHGRSCTSTKDISSVVVTIYSDGRHGRLLGSTNNVRLLNEPCGEMRESVWPLNDQGSWSERATLQDSITCLYNQDVGAQRPFNIPSSSHSFPAAERKVHFLTCAPACASSTAAWVRRWAGFLNLQPLCRCIAVLVALPRLGKRRWLFPTIATCSPSTGWTVVCPNRMERHPRSIRLPKATTCVPRGAPPEPCSVQSTVQSRIPCPAILGRSAGSFSRSFWGFPPTLSHVLPRRLWIF